MSDRLEERLKGLRSDFEAGQKMLSDFEAKEANLRSTLLRISGAIQVLEEMLAGEVPPENGNGKAAGKESPEVGAESHPSRAK